MSARLYDLYCIEAERSSKTPDLGGMVQGETSDSIFRAPDWGTGPGAALLAPAKPGWDVQGESTGFSARALAGLPDATAWRGAAAAAFAASREAPDLGGSGGKQAAGSISRRRHPQFGRWHSPRRQDWRETNGVSRLPRGPRVTPNGGGAAAPPLLRTAPAGTVGLAGGRPRQPAPPRASRRPSRGGVGAPRGASPSPPILTAPAETAGQA